MDLIIDSVILYTVENGILTRYVYEPSSGDTAAHMNGSSIATIASLVCVRHVIISSNYGNLIALSSGL